MNYWLMKTEPDTFSIHDLRNSPKMTASWEGVRNYQARNFMRDQMQKNDLVLIYHSSCKDVGVAGVAEVIKTAHPDLSGLDPKSPYFDPKATQAEPRWYMVDVKWRQTFSEIISLATLKQIKELKEMKILQKGSRLSITPVSKKEFEVILGLAK